LVKIGADDTKRSSQSNRDNGRGIFSYNTLSILQ
jgi:hypothetical protein